MYSAYLFYSRNRGIGTSDVYHSHPACQVARSIAPGFRFAGNPYHWPECPCCLVHRTSRAASVAQRVQQGANLVKQSA